MRKMRLKLKRWFLQRKLDKIADRLESARKVKGGAIGRQTFLILCRRDARRQLKELTRV